MALVKTLAYYYAAIMAIKSLIVQDIFTTLHFLRSLWKAQKARVFVPGKPFQPSEMYHYSLVGPFVSDEENDVLWIGSLECRNTKECNKSLNLPDAKTGCTTRSFRRRGRRETSLIAPTQTSRTSSGRSKIDGCESLRFPSSNNLLKRCVFFN